MSNGLQKINKKSPQIVRQKPHVCSHFFSRRLRFQQMRFASPNPTVCVRSCYLMVCQHHILAENLSYDLSIRGQNEVLFPVSMWYRWLSICLCQCNDNSLIELPVDLGLLKNLEHLKLDNNRISVLPVSLSSMTKLQTISFSANPLVNIPADFPARAGDVRQYLGSLQEDPVKISTVKLVVVGQESVGKTSLLKAIKRSSWILPQRFGLSKKAFKNVRYLVTYICL